MGLARRRHFANKGRQVLAIEDELFGEGHLGVTGEAPGGLSGYSTLLAALETRRTGQLGDIVGTIQAQQDEIIRSPAGRRADRAGRPGHRQDRRRPAPRRVPALHVPVPAGGPGRAGRRAQPGVPALHRAGAALAGRGRRRAGRAVRPGARRRPGRVRDPGLGPRQGRRPHGPRAGQGRARPRAPAAGGPRRALRRDVPPADGRGLGSHREGRPPALPPSQRGPPVRRDRGVRGHGHDRSHRDDGRGRARSHPPPRAGAGGAGAHVAGAEAPRAAPRPLRLPRPAAPRRLEVAVGRRVDGPLSPPPRAREHQRQRCGLVGRRHRAPGRGTGAARAAGQPHQRRRRARSGPTATSWSTRCRTSRRCSCGWWPAARSTAR